MGIPTGKLQTQQKPGEANKLNMGKMGRKHLHYSFINIANVRITYWLIKQTNKQTNLKASVRTWKGFEVVIDFFLSESTRPCGPQEEEKC